ncbi:hypothetical protein B0F90DRAFT_776714 [Multifurca ochricompacta]|uniref:Uncharacterized protein n=1 Tax=Multifurca ochricompacta TaxID=376703 RepID=A0AAD4QS59_9AGAM|nr:hypothetical protein B0F90DRAFT_776714 [Multifurca ochricompacta]
MLLAAVDLRGTGCTWDRKVIPPSFTPAMEKRLFHPTSPLKALLLLSSSVDLLPSSNSNFLHIDHLTHATREHGRGFENPPGGLSCVLPANPKTGMPAHHKASRASNPASLPLEWPVSFSRPPGPCLADEASQSSSSAVADTETPVLRTMNSALAAESNAPTAQYKASMYYLRRSTSTGSSRTYPPEHMLQWGQELLMLYREPPPWSQAQLSPVVLKVAPKSRGFEGLFTVKRTDEKITRGVKKMQDMLVERHRPVQTEIDNSRDNLKASARLFTKRNPFSSSLGGLSVHVHKANEMTPAPSLHTSAAPKSVMVAPPKSLGSLKPISSLPVPIPPGPVRSAANNGGHGGQNPRLAQYGPRSGHDTSRNRKSISPIDDSHDQKGDIMVAAAGNSERAQADPAAKKRSRAEASTVGRKRQKYENEMRMRSLTGPL